MHRILAHSLTVSILLLLTVHSARSDTVRGPTADTADLVRAAYDGDKALETVAYLDQYIRWPGNQGFDAGIDHVVDRLEAAGFARQETAAAGTRLTYRTEEYPMAQPAWEPITASVTIVGQDAPILDFASNRNMLATGSYSTPASGVTAELVDVGHGRRTDLDAAEIRGKIVLAEGEISILLKEAVINRGAIGVLAYSLPDYLKPQINKHSIQFRGIEDDIGSHQAWAIALSTDAYERLKAALAEGNVQLNVMTAVKWTDAAVERTVVADIHGSEYPDERFVFSAHIDEPGANDNASGVGAQLEMARVAADLVSGDKIDPKRTVTFLWGDEIVSTHRYVTQDAQRAKGIRWGLSLDMVGEDTAKTGGTFLIEKMPDPSAIWTRGADKHSEWGGEPMTKADLRPHYFNDLVLGRAREQAATNGWVVQTNPFEGGSDHVPFLEANIPGLLFWHFTDQFYHTDRDRLEMVSAAELKNVGVTALVTAIAMTSADGALARTLIVEVRNAAITRLKAETALSVAAVKKGQAVADERDIITTWAGWYDEAIASMADIEVGGASVATNSTIDTARLGVSLELEESLAKLGE
jgi:hypothetical protein